MIGIESDNVMLAFAVDQEGHRVHVLDAEKGKEYFCPSCGAKVIPRQGEQNAWHFAHAGQCTDTWHYDMTEWHRAWQERYPEECREVVVTVAGQSHRADVLYHGIVIEFQHSPISSAEIMERNSFYNRAGYRVIWVFDAVDLYSSGAIVGNMSDDNKFHWSNPNRSISCICPQLNKSVAVVLQLADPEDEDDEPWLVKVEWAIPDGDGASYKTFIIDDNFYFDILTEEGCIACLQNKKERFNSFLKANTPYQTKCASHFTRYPQEWRICEQTRVEHGDRCRTCPHCLVREFRQTTPYQKGGEFLYCCWPRVVNPPDAAGVVTIPTVNLYPKKRTF